MADKPIITVFLMAYEQAEYLKECLDALLIQSFQAFDVHCFVDRDRPAVLATLSSYERQFHRLVLHVSDSFGAAAEVNRFLRTAETPYVLFLHAGDYLRDSFLATGLTMAEENNADAVICDAGQRHLRSGILRETVHTLQVSRLPEKDCFTLSDIKGDGLTVIRFPSWLCLFRTEFLREWEILCLESGFSNNVFMGRCGKNLCSSEAVGLSA